MRACVCVCARVRAPACVRVRKAGICGGPSCELKSNDGKKRLSHRVSTFPSFHTEPSVPSRSGRNKTSVRVDYTDLRRIVGVAPLTDRHDWNKGAFPCTEMGIISR